MKFGDIFAKCVIFDTPPPYRSTKKPTLIRVKVQSQFLGPNIFHFPPKGFLYLIIIFVEKLSIITVSIPSILKKL